MYHCQLEKDIFAPYSVNFFNIISKISDDENAILCGGQQGKLWLVSTKSPGEPKFKQDLSLPDKNAHIIDMINDRVSSDEFLLEVYLATFFGLHRLIYL